MTDYDGLFRGRCGGLPAEGVGKDLPYCLMVMLVRVGGARDSIASLQNDSGHDNGWARL